MKAKTILYGWAASWLFLFAGIGTMENGNYITGMLLFLVWVAFSLLLILHKNECMKEYERMETNFDNLLKALAGINGLDRDLSSKN